MVMISDYTGRQVEIMELALGIIDDKGIQELTTKNLAAEIGLSEAALYRHFKSKTDILLQLLDYFMLEMKERIAGIAAQDEKSSIEVLKEIFASQIRTFYNKPAIVSIIFSEGIFQFNKELMQKVSGMMVMMQTFVDDIVRRGQKEGTIRDFAPPSTMSTIIMGSMRLAVMKWKIFGRKSDLVKDGNKVLNAVLRMIENN